MTTTMTDLMTDLPTDLGVDPCGCMMTPDGFLPCAACKAEVAADLMEVYGDNARVMDDVAAWLEARVA